MGAPGPEWYKRAEQLGGLEVEASKPMSIACIGCGKPIGHLLMRVERTPGCHHWFQAVVACDDCGPDTAILALLPIGGQA